MEQEIYSSSKLVLQIQRTLEPYNSNFIVSRKEPQGLPSGLHSSGSQWKVKQMPPLKDWKGATLGQIIEL
jgi:hypothetical protein